MERTMRRVRQIRMMELRPVRGPAGRHGILGVLGAGLLCAALAGCGSVVASSAAAGAGATPAAADSPAAPVGCASVNQATVVSIYRVMPPMSGSSPLSTYTYHQVPQLRALFGQLCAAVTHPARNLLMHCPADRGTEFVGTFFDGPRELARFTFAASGCERVSVTAAGKTLATMVYGSAAAAAPHLASDLAAVVGSPGSGGMMQPGGTVNPGGPNKPA
jgi:hypothetical protein